MGNICQTIETWNVMNSIPKENDHLFPLKNRVHKLNHPDRGGGGVIKKMMKDDSRGKSQMT